ncbi:hypothetical protein QNH36_23100 [Mesobacillus sp. AQ2]|jgi:hypothetical protein|uniref:hypothetical protein n=1 Tax=Bacillaceae TaxID=186817 RepID=UPI0011A014AA|nr:MULTISPECIES: hypothetical protein [Bacillaceae]WHX40491.1 hypothetical protein QNH36_23100 [Mesobacillus sp. AQ2]
MKKTAVGLFHILPAESEAPETKINSRVLIAKKMTANPFKSAALPPKGSGYIKRLIIFHI